MTLQELEVLGARFGDIDRLALEELRTRKEQIRRLLEGARECLEGEGGTELAYARTGVALALLEDM